MANPEESLGNSAPFQPDDGESATAGEAKPVWNVQDLVRLAKDNSKQGRSDLVKAVRDLHFGAGPVLTESDRAIMFDILRLLIHEIEISVRRQIAEDFAVQRDVPKDIIDALAKDDIEVAYPVLVRSELLNDAALVEIIQQRAMEHHLAIAMRSNLAEPVCDALVETQNDEVIQTLLSNDGARISGPTLETLVDVSRRIVRYQRPLSFRRDLSPKMVKDLYSFVSAALRQHITANYNLDPEAFDDAAEAVIAKSVSDGADGADDAPVETPGLKALMELLNGGHLFKFIENLAAISRLRIALLRRFLFEPGGKDLAVICRAIGLGKTDFARILVNFRDGRLGDKQVPDNEITTATRFFSGVGLEAAETLLRRWQRDETYLDAIEVTEEIPPL